MFVKIFYMINYVDLFVLVFFDKWYFLLKNLEVVDLIIFRVIEGLIDNEVIIFKLKNVCVYMKMFILKKIKFERGFFLWKKMIKLNINLDYFFLGIFFGYLIN